MTIILGIALLITQCSVIGLAYTQYRHYKDHR